VLDDNSMYSYLHTYIHTYMYTLDDNLVYLYLGILLMGSDEAGNAYVSFIYIKYIFIRMYIHMFTHVYVPSRYKCDVVVCMRPHEHM